MEEIIELPVRNEIATRAAMEMANGPLKMAMQAIKAGLSIADMREMLVLQKEYEANEARKDYAMAMSGFKSEPMEIIKAKQVGFYNKKNQFVGYKHAELSDVTDAICPAMSRHQLSHRWDIEQNGNFIKVSCRITHAHGHSESICMTANPDASGQKNAIQQIASTVTYLQRYTLLAITGMSTKGEDDDGKGGEDEKGSDDDQFDTGRTSADEGVSLARTATKPTTPPVNYYPLDKFNENLPKWTEVIASGKQTAQRMVDFLCTKHPLTDLQKKTLLAIKTA